MLFCQINILDSRWIYLQVLGRTLKVDHVANYKPPKEDKDLDDITKAVRERGCAPKVSSDDELEEMLPIKVKKG